MEPNNRAGYIASMATLDDATLLRHAALFSLVGRSKDFPDIQKELEIQLTVRRLGRACARIVQTARTMKDTASAYEYITTIADRENRKRQERQTDRAPRRSRRTGPASRHARRVLQKGVENDHPIGEDA